MRRLSTTTTTTAPAPQLTDLQRHALLAGELVRLRRGHPARRLVLFLGEQARLADDAATRAERIGGC